MLLTCHTNGPWVLLLLTLPTGRCGASCGKCRLMWRETRISQRLNCLGKDDTRDFTTVELGVCCQPLGLDLLMESGVPGVVREVTSTSNGIIMGVLTFQIQIGEQMPPITTAPRYFCLCWSLGFLNVEELWNFLKYKALKLSGICMAERENNVVGNYSF